VGLEARCEVRCGDERRVAGVHLDSTGLEVRGRSKLPLGRIRGAEAVGGELRVRSDEGVLVLALGAEADRWARFIASPRTRIDKLGVKPGQRVALVGLDDAELRGELRAAGVTIVGRGAVDVVFFWAGAERDLARLAACRRRVEPNGAVWLVRDKGKAATVKESAVRAAARAAGLVDVKVVAFSETRSTDKLVVPVAARGRARPRMLP